MTIHFYLAATVILIFYLVIEYLILYISLRKIPVRILVNGTRGKTTMVRILHRILIESGYLTFSKITGDVPLILHPDGQEQKIRRLGPANIRENIRLLLKCLRYKPQVVVMECMALHPEMQKSLARRIFNPTHIGITNVKPDHLEVMGNNRSDLFQVISESFTAKSRKFLPRNLADCLQESTSATEQFDIYDSLNQTTTYRNIPEEIVAESRGLIKALGEDLQLDRQTIDRVFLEKWQDIDNRLRIEWPELNLVFFDLFSVNDPETTAQFVKHIRSGRSASQRELVILNLRADRPLRTQQFRQLLPELFPAVPIWVTGSGRYHLSFRKESTNINRLKAANIIRRLKEGFPANTSVFGLANHHGAEPLLTFLRGII